MRKCWKEKLCWVQVLIRFSVLVCLCEISYSIKIEERIGGGERNFGAHLSRNKRSIKDALPKDDEFTQARVLLQMRHKITSLESSMKAVNTELDELSEKNSELESSFSKQNVILEKLDGELNGLKSILTSHASSLTDLETLASPDENLFALSNHTCGEALVAQSGSILFSSSAIVGRYPWSCIWTIRANNRAFIRVSSNYVTRYGYSRRNDAYAIELIKDNTTSSFKLKTTKIHQNMHQIFSGPLLFIVCFLTSESEVYTDYELQLQYEGMGKLVEKSTFYSHSTLYNTSGSFSEVEMPRSADLNYTTEFSTIVVSNFSTKVHLQSVFPNGKCADGDSFLVLTDLLNVTAVGRDCCKESCDGRNAIVNYNYPFLILIRKQFQRQMRFNMTWIAETPYPSSSSSVYPGSGSYSYKCGEILGGSSGSIYYKPHVNYRNGERCIWTIVPQPRPRSSIIVSVGTNGIENTYDHLYMLELTNSTGEDLPEPRITSIGRYGMYTAYSREVYVVFYSDSTVTGYGFSLTWRLSGEVRQPKDVSTRFTILRDNDGEAQSVDLKPPFINDNYQVFLLTPIMPAAYIFGMHLYINQTSPLSNSGDNCLSSDIQVYTALDGMLNKTHLECQTPGQVEIENADGMAMIIVKNEQNSAGNVSMNFSWRQVYGEGNASYVVVENNECGGIIEGDKGMLKYKIGTDYYNNERCVWLLHSPNSTNITLKLQKDGFETCCDFILVNTIEPNNGTLRNESFWLNRTNRTKTFNGNFLIITFKSDASTRGRGFALQFTGNGDTNIGTPSKYRYQLRHHMEPFGTIKYPDPEWQDPVPSKEDVLVIAYSLKVGAEEDPRLVPTNISWISGTFLKHSEDCIFDSMTFYTPSLEAEGWQMSLRYPNATDIEDCPDKFNYGKMDDVVSDGYSAFIGIYKPVVDSAMNLSRIGFSFEKAAGCGGVIVGENGEISYKENGRYSNLEKCIWLVEAPEASKMRFYLERSGFEDCCDYLSIISINAETGNPDSPVIVTQTNRTAILNGSVAVVIFTSDASVVGDGFRLRFSTHERISADVPFRVHLEHQNQPKENNFVYQADSNQLVVMAYSPEVFKNYVPSSTTRQTEVTVLSFRPQIDHDCNSDTLSIYEVYGRDRGIVLAKTYAADQSLAHSGENDTSTCSPRVDSDFGPCDNILECGDAPEESRISVETTSFLAVYKSVNGTDSALRFRGFVMVSASKSNDGSSVYGGSGDGPYH